MFTLRPVASVTPLVTNYPWLLPLVNVWTSPGSCRRKHHGLAWYLDGPSISSLIQIQLQDRYSYKLYLYLSISSFWHSISLGYDWSSSSSVNKSARTFREFWSIYVYVPQYTLSEYINKGTSNILQEYMFWAGRKMTDCGLAYRKPFVTNKYQWSYYSH